MPSSQAEINFIFLILYNRKDWNYTLSRIPPNKREIRTLRGNIKKYLQNLKWFLEWKPKKGQLRKSFCKVHLEKSLRGPQQVKGSLFLSSPFIRAAQFYYTMYFYQDFVWRRQGSLAEKTVKTVELNDCYLFQSGMLMCIVYWEIFF